MLPSLAPVPCMLIDAGAASDRPPAGGNTITTGMHQPAATASGSQAPSSCAPLATAATLAQGIPPTDAPLAAGAPSDTAGKPEAAAAPSAAEKAGAAGPNASEPPPMFPAASLRLPSAELQSAAGASAGGNARSGINTPQEPNQHAGGTDGRPAASCGDYPKQHAAGAESYNRGDSSSSKQLPKSQYPTAGEQRTHAAVIDVWSFCRCVC